MSEQDPEETIDLETRIGDLIEEITAAHFVNPPELQEEEEKANNEGDTSTDLSHQSTIMSSTPDPVLNDIFGNATALDDAAIASSLSTHKKGDRALMDPKTLSRIKQEATKTLDIIFKVQSALGTSGVKGEENPDLDTTMMATVFAENTHVLEKLSRVIEDYDMISATQIRRVVDNTKSHPIEKYDQTKYTDMLKEVGTLELAEVKEYSGDIMKYDVQDGPNRQNLSWLLLLVRNNMSSSISALIEPAFDRLDVCHKNGAVYLAMVIELCFAIDEHVIEALKTYINKFGKTGLSAFEGENVNMASIEILAIAKRLHQLGELPNDAPKTVLKGLQKVTHNYEFKQTFALIANFQRQTVISVTSASTNASPLDLIESYFEQAKVLYTSAVLRNNWAGKKPGKFHNNVGFVPTCWNCGGPHSLKDCKEEKNQTRIQKAKDAFFENKKKNNGGGHQSKGDGENKPKGYTRSGFGKESSANGVITTADGQVYTSCKYGTCADGCGMNQTHSSKYHEQWKADKESFKLPSTHPFMVALAGKGKICLPASSATAGTNQEQINMAVHQALAQFKSDTAHKLSILET